jgi:hypothetical protein
MTCGGRGELIVHSRRILQGVCAHAPARLWERMIRISIARAILIILSYCKLKMTLGSVMGVTGFERRPEDHDATRINWRAKWAIPC